MRLEGEGGQILDGRLERGDEFRGRALGSSEGTKGGDRQQSCGDLGVVIAMVTRFVRFDDMSSGRTRLRGADSRDEQEGSGRRTGSVRCMRQRQGHVADGVI
jgi:hypothetical protein